MRLNFSFKYVFEQDNLSRLVFLYIANVKNESDISESTYLKGKFWTIKQIEDNMYQQEGDFSGCYLQEHEFLRNTVETLSLVKEYTNPT